MLPDNATTTNNIVLKKYASQEDFDKGNPYEIIELPNDIFPISDILNQGVTNVT